MSCVAKNINSINKHIERFKQAFCKKMMQNTVWLADGSTVKFSMGMVYLTESEEVIGKYKKISEYPEKYTVECNGEHTGTVVLEGKLCKIIRSGKVLYTAKGKNVKDITGAQIAKYSGDIVGAAAAFLCLI